MYFQKYSHLQLAHQEHPRPYFKSVLWWGGIILMAVGETGNFAAYGFAPITLIAPLGCMSVTGSAIISVMFLKENLRASDLLASLTVISVKAVSGMITFSVTDKMQLTYPIFYIMFIIMIASCVFQVKLLNQATKLYNTATVVPINHTFFTISAIIAGKQMLDKIQPDSNGLSYGTLPDGSDSTKSPSGEKKEV
eukprot:bmy_10838T0